MDDTTTSVIAAEAETTAVSAAPRDPLPDIEALVERWWEEHFPGSPVAQVTQAWNHALAAKDDLKRRLQQFGADMLR